MTIKLLTPRSPYPINAIISLDAATEAALVSDKVASTDLTGGVAYTGPAVPSTPPALQAWSRSDSSVSGAGNPVSISFTAPAVVGSTLTAVLAAGWTATGYQWKRAGSNISGATASTYVLTDADAGQAITVVPAGLAAVATGPVIPAPLLPSNMFVLQNIRSFNQAVTARVIPKGSVRTSAVIRNKEAARILQVGTITNNMNNNTAPSTWVDVNPGDEWYEDVFIEQSVWMRPKTDGQSCLAEIQWQAPRV